MTTQYDIVQHEQSGSWRDLMSIAKVIVDDAERTAGSSLKPLLGGGTRLMVSLLHRMSDDIDLFIRDPQWIGYLSPRLNDRVEALTDTYEENAVSLKLRFANGEIDFIVAMSLLNLPNQSMPGIPFELEPIAEVLAKKLFYRGIMLTPRDLHDWWAIDAMVPDELPHDKLAKLLKGREDGIENALDAMCASNGAIERWNALRAPTKPTLEQAVEFAKRVLTAYRLESTYTRSSFPSAP